MNLGFPSLSNSPKALCITFSEISQLKTHLEKENTQIKLLNKPVESAPWRPGPPGRRRRRCSGPRRRSPGATAAAPARSPARPSRTACPTACHTCIFTRRVGLSTASNMHSSTVQKGGNRHPMPAAMQSKCEHVKTPMPISFTSPSLDKQEQHTASNTSVQGTDTSTHKCASKAWSSSKHGAPVEVFLEVLVHGGRQRVPDADVREQLRLRDVEVHALQRRHVRLRARTNEHQRQGTRVGEGAGPQVCSVTGQGSTTHSPAMIRHP